MIVTAITAAGAGLFLGTRKRIWQRQPKKLAEILQPEQPVGLKPLAAGRPDTSRQLALSAGMLGLTTLGRLSFPLLGLAALPGLLYLNLPFLRAGRQEVVEERRVGVGVLDSLASLGMLALGDFFADALFLLLYFLSCRMLEETRDQMQTAQMLAGQPNGLWTRELQGERLVDFGSLPMLALGAVTWPLLGVQQAVAVLVNYFGFDLRVVAPLSVLSYLQLAARHGIQVKDGRALEALHDPDLIFVFDEAAVARPEAPAIIDALAKRQRPVITNTGDLQQNDVLPSLPPAAGRPICFVGASLDNPAAHQAEVIVSWASAPAAAAEGTHILLLADNLTQLAVLVDLAEGLDRNIKTSFMLTAAPSVLCLAGIYLLNFGVVTAIVLNYLGLGLSTLYAVSPRFTAGLASWALPAPQRRYGRPESEHGSMTKGVERFR